VTLSRTALSLLTVLLVLAGLLAGVGWRLLSNDLEEGANGNQSQLPDTEGVEAQGASQFAGPQLVEGVVVIRDTLWVPVAASGQAVANRQSQVATRTAGLVEAVNVEENDLVEAGALLVLLDTAEVAMERARAESELLSAQVEFEERMLFAGDDPLLDEDGRRERERIVRATSGLNQAEVSMEQARMEMEWTRIRAPFPGRVADLQAVEGAYLSSGDEVLTLVELDPIRVEVHALESEVALLEPGRRATVRFAAFPGQEFTATVRSVNPIVDAETRSARVTLALPNPDHRIRPGMYARVSVDAQAYPDRILVPRSAVVERDRREVVFMASGLDDEGEARAEWRYVTTGFRNETHVEIVPDEATSLLEPGEVVLVDGHHYLAHDTRIRLETDPREGS
jgi:membrane fusion protein, multidrug efflux system